MSPSRKKPTHTEDGVPLEVAERAFRNLVAKPEPEPEPEDADSEPDDEPDSEPGGEGD